MKAPRVACPEGVAPGAAFTFAELIVAMSLSLIVMATVYGMLAMIFGGSRNPNQGVAGQTSASFLRQDARLALQKLVDRLQEGIELVSPAPGQTARELDFMDVLNNRVRLKHDPASGALVSYRVAADGTVAAEAEVYLPVPGASPFVATRPIELKDVDSISFTGLSHDLVAVNVTLRDGERRASILTQVRLRNGEMVP